MDSPERQSVRRALDSLKPYLEAFLSQLRVRVESAVPGQQRSAPDVQSLLRACVNSWDSVLSNELPRVARSYIHELIDVRNRWAHEAPFSASEAARAIDTARLLGSLVGAPVAASSTTSAPARIAQAGTKGRETQRQAMSRIFTAVGRDEERAIREYAAAELRGEVRRKSNKHGIDAEAYARALLLDGLKKGWLSGA